MRNLRTFGLGLTLVLTFVILPEPSYSRTNSDFETQSQTSGYNHDNSGTQTTKWIANVCYLTQDTGALEPIALEQTSELCPKLRDDSQVEDAYTNLAFFWKRKNCRWVCAQMGARHHNLWQRRNGLRAIRKNMQLNSSFLKANSTKNCAQTKARHVLFRYM